MKKCLLGLLFSGTFLLLTGCFDVNEMETVGSENTDEAILETMEATIHFNHGAVTILGYGVNKAQNTVFVNLSWENENGQATAMSEDFPTFKAEQYEDRNYRVSTGTQLEAYSEDERLFEEIAPGESQQVKLQFVLDNDVAPVYFTMGNNQGMEKHAEFFIENNDD